jgi:hypothetical protein
VIEITRFNDVVSLTAASSAATTTPRVAFSRHSRGVVLIGNTGGCTEIQWHGAAGAESLPLQVYAGGNAVTSAVVVGAVVIPDAVFALPFIVPVVSGGTSCAMTVCMKG